jgi:hypothetical protein
MKSKSKKACYEAPARVIPMTESKLKALAEKDVGHKGPKGSKGKR